MRVSLSILDRDIAIDCTEHEARRLEDLADALRVRLAGFSGDPDAMRRLVLAALSLMDEAQAANAALARARAEIERLTDLLVDAKLAEQEAVRTDDRGRVSALRAAPGIA
jgi:cell division protein ZapA (FtsZ GTPase activity inhibitor)